MLESCTRADLITEITLQPMRRYRVDAAILFSDIVVPLKAIGFGIDIKAGVGPVIEEPIREPARPGAAAPARARRRAVHHRGRGGAGTASSGTGR